MIYIVVIFIVAYLIAMTVVILGMLRLSIYHGEKGEAQTKFSVIIPFRNEAERLPELLNSIKKLNYPSHLYEVIFVDDASEDESISIITNALQKEKNTNSPTFKVIPNLRLSRSPKKDAITEAISHSENNWIITTDADCILPDTWLAAFDAYIKKNEPVLVAAPVSYKSNRSFVEQFQKLDGLSLQMVTMASFGLEAPLLSNGANLAYKKEAFLKVKGFSENNHIASGDDIFILEKIQASFPGKAKFLKSRDAIVDTFPEKDWTSAIRQRIRWASKTSKQNNRASKALGGLVFFANLMAIIGAFLYLFNSQVLSIYLPAFLLKVLVDFIVLKVGSQFFKTKIDTITFWGSLIIYPFIILRVVLGSLKGNYNWKGRKFGKQR